MDRDAFLIVLKKYQTGEASGEEVEFLHAYYNLFEVHENGLDAMDPAAKRLLKDEIKAGIDARLAPSTYPAGNRWKKIFLPIAATVLLAAATGLYFAFQKSDSAQIPVRPVENHAGNIAPGGNYAVLTLGNGSVIRLDDQADGVLASEAGATIRKNAAGEIEYETDSSTLPITINTISTPRGGQYRLLLADGSKVWLNAATTLKFPAVFRGNQRYVEVSGEAYFEVAHNARMPFIVRSGTQEIAVLGTHFNVNTYDDEPYDKTTLLEGSIRIERRGPDGNIHTSRIMKPGQVAAVAKGGTRIDVAPADTDAAVAWKNGYFKFHKTDLKTIMRQVSRWYNVDVTYNGEFDKDLFSGKINRSDSVSGVLSILKYSNINASIQGRTIVISN